MTHTHAGMLDELITLITELGVGHPDVQGRIEQLKGALAHTVDLPAELHPDTAALVVGFASAVGQKLFQSQQKYGYMLEWQDPEVREQRQNELLHHLHKGDARDVGAYAAFCWHHGWATSDQAASTGGKINLPKKSGSRFG